MSLYIRNRRCHCLRCRVRNLMGGAILVTIGVLFLLQTYDIVDFDQTWPVLLIVIGLLAFAARSASTEGHVSPAWYGNFERRVVDKWGTAQGGPQSSPTQNNPQQSGTGPEPNSGWEVKP